MKKKWFAVVIILNIFIGINISAQCKDDGQNFSNGKITSEYSCEDKELKLYGSNKNGSLGTGNTNDVNEENSVIVNNLIGNRDIVDYFISLNNTYVVTSDNRVYASGIDLPIGGNLKSNKFVEIFFYNQNVDKIISIDGIKSNTDYLSGKIDYNITFKTSNTKIFNVVDMSLIHLENHGDDYCNRYVVDADYYSVLAYPKYVNKSKSTTMFVQIDRNKSIIYKGYSSKNGEISQKYSKNKLIKSLKYSKNVKSLWTYSNNKIIQKDVFWYSRMKNKNNWCYQVVKKSQKITYKNNRASSNLVYNYLYKKKMPLSGKKYLYSKRIFLRNKDGSIKEYRKYKYNSYKKTTYKLIQKGKKNKLFKRLTTYKYSKKKLLRINYYIYNKQGKLKSNKYGKSYKIASKYNKKGKRILKVTYKYNAKGKAKKIS